MDVSKLVGRDVYKEGCIGVHKQQVRDSASEVQVWTIHLQGEAYSRYFLNGSVVGS